MGTFLNTTMKRIKLFNEESGKNGRKLFLSIVGTSFGLAHLNQYRNNHPINTHVTSFNSMKRELSQTLSPPFSFSSSSLFSKFYSHAEGITGDNETVVEKNTGIEFPTQIQTTEGGRKFYLVSTQERLFLVYLLRIVLGFM